MLDYAALSNRRQALIRQILNEKGRVVCVGLFALFGVSACVINLYLHELSNILTVKRSIEEQS